MAEKTTLMECPDCRTVVTVLGSENDGWCEGCKNRIKRRVLLPHHGPAPEPKPIGKEKP